MFIAEGFCHTGLEQIAGLSSKLAAHAIIRMILRDSHYHCTHTHTHTNTHTHTHTHIHTHAHTQIKTDIKEGTEKYDMFKITSCEQTQLNKTSSSVSNSS